jgi:hypothetical protein
VAQVEVHAAAQERADGDLLRLPSKTVRPFTVVPPTPPITGPTETTTAGFTAASRFPGAGSSAAERDGATP